MMSEQHDEITRLLDGEMSAHERLNFLQNLDQHNPRGWRDLALGFVEKQMITEALRSQQTARDNKVLPLNKPSTWNLAWTAGVAAALLLGLFFGTMNSRKNPNTKINPGISSTPEKSETSRTSSQQANHNIALTGGVPPLEKLNSALEKHGYNPQMTRGYIEAQLADGRQLIVPISQLAMSKKK